MLDDRKLDELVRRHGTGYRASEPPADELWTRIESEVAAAVGGARRRRFGRRLWIGIGSALAAALVIGVGIGRWTVDRRTAIPPALARAAPRDDSLRLAAHARATTLDYLGEAEVFLTEVRANLRSGRDDADRARRSRDLLARTRLLLNSPAARSPDVARLLEDLELVLAEISALPDSGHPADATMLEETLRDANILPRIRTTLPPRGVGL